MSYLENTVLEMKEKIILVFQRLNNTTTEKQAADQIQNLQSLIKANLIQSFKNGIEIDRKQAGPNGKK